MVKEYIVIKDGVFPKPFDKAGLKMKLEEKRAKSFVEKGDLEEKKKPVQKKGGRPKKSEDK